MNVIFAITYLCIKPHATVPVVSALFEGLDKEVSGSAGSSLGVISYGIAMTTLEEVFLELGMVLYDF